MAAIRLGIARGPKRLFVYYVARGVDVASGRVPIL